MLNRRFILRQLASAKKQSIVFVLCVALSMVTLVSLGGFSDSVNQVLTQDSRELHAGDIIIQSSRPLEMPLADAVDTLVAEGEVERAKLYEFISIVRVTAEDNSLLSTIKVVEPKYPFYGEVVLESGRDFQAVLTSGNIVVAQAVLERLNLQLGDPLRIGEATLTIQDVVLEEPDRPVELFSFGPRIFVAEADLEAIDLISDRSRVRFTTLLQVPDEGNINSLAAQLQAVSTDREEVETFRTAESGVRRFLDNFIFFLSLVGVFTLLLAGIGIQSSLTAVLKEKETTIAIVKTMGATHRFVTVNYLALVIILGIIGTVIGFILGVVLQTFFPVLFAGLLPDDVELSISVVAILENFALGLFIVIVFTFLPLYRLNDLKPRFIFRKEIGQVSRRWPYYLTLVVIYLFFTGLVLWQLGSIEVGLYFVGGITALILLTTLITEGTLFVLKRQRIKNLMARQALKGLFRPRNGTRAIIITLTSSLAVLFTLYLVEQNLDANFVRSFPEDAPNVFFIDIQPDQVNAFAEVVGRGAEYFPVVRADITAVNDETIDPEVEDERPGDNLGRTFNLSYRDQLAEVEQLLEGNTIFTENRTGVEVSILDDMLDMRDFEIGDIITFKIQGVPLEATISSIRTIEDEESFSPFFLFIFPKEILESAPQTIFTALRLDADELPPLQNKLVAEFPNVSVIDITATIAEFAELLENLTTIIRFFTVFSLIAGLLIIISSILATRFARVQEAVYFKVLGAKGRFVLQVFTIENLLLGFISAVLALLMSQIGSWLIVTLAFELDYRLFILPSVVMIIGTMVLVTTVGMLASISILRQRPIIFLREQSGE
ncbi:MAG: FtsX-like permease family protein [Chloroflexota bacterium]